MAKLDTGAPAGMQVAIVDSRNRDRDLPIHDLFRAINLFSTGGAMRSILLWLLGIPIPIIILIALFTH